MPTWKVPEKTICTSSGTITAGGRGERTALFCNTILYAPPYIRVWLMSKNLGAIYLES